MEIYQAQMTDDWLDSKVRKVTPLKLFFLPIKMEKKYEEPCACEDHNLCAIKCMFTH